MAEQSPALDELDLALLTALREQPRAGALELSRLLRVARATVSARLRRLEESGVITGYGPDVDLAAAGYPVQAFVTLEIAQGALEQIAHELEAIPGVVEAYATTGTGDVLCRIAAASHEDLQATLLLLNNSTAIDRSTSVICLSTVVPRRVMPLLGQAGDRPASRAPAFRGRATPGGTLRISKPE
ncbi:MAG TPA: Lrp/AsnC family transcriptional regulator [Pseudonocardia sp.]|jgi:DNA-binding Lrp family transcriptional regulator|nr:Lrp/AsnC family transcriptional regulator [Pseudonocardia sp.]